MGVSLLPDSAGLFDRALEESLADRWNILNGAVPAINSAKLVSRPPSFLPFLVYEYGLGELTPYVPNLYDLIDQGLRWQRVRGSHQSVATALGFIGYAAAVEEAWPGRVFWNSMQLRLAALPANDRPDLGRIEALTTLSLPKRSRLRRGVHLYDVGAVEADHARLDGAMLERESGVAVDGSEAIWSFGRAHEHDVTLTKAEGLAIGNWIEPPLEPELAWGDMDYPWGTADVPWGAAPAVQRRTLMAAWFNARPVYLRFSRANGSVIGYRRARAVHAVKVSGTASYQMAGQGYQPQPGGEQVYVEAMTGFGDGAGETAASVHLAVNLTLGAGVTPGKLWLAANEVTGATLFASRPLNLTLRETVREQFKYLVRF